MANCPAGAHLFGHSLGSSPILLPKPSLIAPNPAASASRHEGRFSRKTQEIRAFSPISRAALQAGGHRFDPGWLHHLTEGRTTPVPGKGTGASASVGRVERVRRLLEALGEAGRALPLGALDGCMLEPSSARQEFERRTYGADERTRTSTWLPRHGPELCRTRPDASARVQVVRFAGFHGRIGRIGRDDCCQTVATRRMHLETSGAGRSIAIVRGIGDPKPQDRSSS